MAVETATAGMNSLSVSEKAPLPEPQPTKADGASKTPLTEPSNISNSKETPRKTQFAEPSAASTTIPAPQPLKPEQETKYKSLLDIVSAWPRETPAVAEAATNGEKNTTSQTEVASTSASASSSSPSPPPLTDQEVMWLTREGLLRYLRASSWDLGVAAKRIIATLAWRRSFGLWDKLTAEYVSIESETGKLWILGYDNAGRPCLYMNPHLQNTPKSDRQIEHLVFMMERCLDIAPVGQETLAQLMNFKDTRSGQGASIAQGRQTLNIMQSHYPERLGRALLINLPWHISGFMRLILPFVDPVTRNKLIFNEEMRTHVPAEHLRVSHGGNLEFEYDHAVYWPALIELAAARRADMLDRWVRGGKQIGESEDYLKGGASAGVAGVAGGAGGAAGTGSSGQVKEVKDILAPAVQRDGETFEDAPETAPAAAA